MSTQYIIISILFSTLRTYSAQHPSNPTIAIIKNQNSIADSATTKHCLAKRPAPIQAAVNRAFEKNKKNRGAWGCNGSSYYNLLNLDQDKLLSSLTSINPHKKDIYIIDVGCGNGAWGKHAASILNFRECNEQKRRFHILSLTGGIECDEIKEHKNYVTRCQLNQFKIENIDEELSKRGFDITGNVDLIVSRWTLCHLVDPFGTLQRMHRLLTPRHGMLLSNGFIFKYDDTNQLQTFPADNQAILMVSNAISLFRYSNIMHDAGHFLIMRTDEQDLKLPLAYTNTTDSVDSPAQCASGVITIYKRYVHQFDEQRLKMTEHHVYYLRESQQARKLYDDLVDKDLLEQPKNPS